MRAGGQLLAGFDDDRCAAARFASIREQCHARAFLPEHGSGERSPHESELDEVLAADLNVGADIKQCHGATRNWHRRCQRRAVDAACALDFEQSGGKRRAGRAGADERIGFALRYGARSLDDRGLGSGARCARWVGLLRDRDRRVDHFDPFGYLTDLLGRAVDADLDAKLSGDRSAGRYFGGSKIGPVRVDRDRDAHRGLLVGVGRGDD